MIISIAQCICKIEKNVYADKFGAKGLSTKLIFLRRELISLYPKRGDCPL